MTPLETLSNWLSEQDNEVQTDAAFLVSALLFDDFPKIKMDEFLPNLMAWLGVKNLSSFELVGRSIRFRACFELACGNRFTEAGWVAPEQIFRNVIAEGVRNPESDRARLAPKAFPMLRQLPARKEKWMQVGASWNKLVQEHLSNECLQKVLSTVE